MTCAVRYYTKTGNTKKLADAIAKVVGVEALPISTPVTEKVDLLFLGNSGRIVNFGTAALLNSTYKKVKAVADKAGIPMHEKEFHCKGEFNGLHKGKPDEKDLKAAAEFARNIIA